jgi:hypothetical protein
VPAPATGVAIIEVEGALIGRRHDSGSSSPPAPLAWSKICCGGAGLQASAAPGPCQVPMRGCLRSLGPPGRLDVLRTLVADGRLGARRADE